MIVGFYTKEISSTDLHDVLCPTCGTPISVSISQRCFHLFFIPTFPLDRFTTIQCYRCRLRFEEKGFPAEMIEEMKQQQEWAQTSLSFYAGLILIGLGIVSYGAYYGAHKFIQGKRTDEYVADPKVHDLYILPVSGNAKFPYLICELNAMTRDSITIAFGTKAYASDADAEEEIERKRHEGWRFFVDELTIPRDQIGVVAEKAKEKGDVVVVRPEE